MILPLVNSVELVLGDQASILPLRGQSSVLPPPSTIVLDSNPDKAPDECVHSESSLPSQKNSKNLAKYLAMGKERYFGSKVILRGRTFHPEVRTLDVVMKVLDLLYFQGWVDLFLDTRLMVYKNEVVEFNANLNVLEDNVATSSVNGVELVFDAVCLGEIFHIPTARLSEYVCSKDDNYILIPNILREGSLLSVGRFLRKSFKDVEIVNALENKDPIDWPILMIKHMARGEYMFTRSTLVDNRLHDENDQVHATPPRATCPVTSLLNDLHAARAQNDVLCAEIET
ncbi:hypothetical protein H5410_040500 [Solanum commersonii]|uniref:Uncharacterized protein n=1 Tax=Solanum commersonii TaxID=4109 RepID=A0A9J5XQB6_SOLCO|nr:hypothetical protein H5410_040500 [Solanum commersonii]